VGKLLRSFDGHGKVETERCVFSKETEMPRIYPFKPSAAAAPDGTIRLCIEPKSMFRIKFFRHCGLERLEALSMPAEESRSDIDVENTSHGIVMKSKGTPGDGAPDKDWSWPYVVYKVAPSWRSGVYFGVAYSVTSDGMPADSLGIRIETNKPITLNYVDGKSDGDSMALFVVKPNPVNTCGEIAYVLALATYHAYNGSGGGCFYNYDNNCPKTISPALKKVTFRRPGGGVGEFSGEPPDDWDPTSPRQTFAHWDSKFMQYLAWTGYNVDYFTDFDLHESNFLVSHQTPQYQICLSVGHHEYWSFAMKNNIDYFCKKGGRLAVFSGNTCYRKIEVDMTNGTITNVDGGWGGNEQYLIGLTYAKGGGWWGKCEKQKWAATKREKLGFKVVSEGHKIFNATGLENNDTFGSSEALVGYECDGKEYAEVLVLGQATLGAGWNDGSGNTAAMVEYPVVIYQGEEPIVKSTVLNFGTTDWARVLVSSGPNSAIWRITNNALSYLFLWSPPEKGEGHGK
jgi:hypothetical protein